MPAGGVDRTAPANLKAAYIPVTAAVGDLVHGFTGLCIWGFDVAEAMGRGGGAGAEQWHRGGRAGAVQVGAVDDAAGGGPAEGEQVAADPADPAGAHTRSGIVGAGLVAEEQVRWLEWGVGVVGG